MERNADDTFGATGNPGSTGGTGSMGSGSSVGSTGMSGTGSSSSGLDYSASGSQTNMGSDPATTAEKAKDAVQDKFGQIKDKARNLQSTLADRLDQGADKIRQRNASSTLTGATGDGGSVAVTDNQAKMQDSVARGMQKSADWLRNGDLKADVERQVRENPGRTLLVAVGLGYLLGKAFRGPNR